KDSVESRVGVDTIGVGALVSAETGGGGLGDQAGVLVVVDVGAVQGDVVLIAPGTQNFTAGGYSGLQAQQFDDVARLQWELADLCFAERIAHARIGRVDLRGLGGDVHNFSR